MQIFFSRTRKSIGAKIALAFFLFVSLTASAGNVDVTATAGTLFAPYNTLKEAFDAINAGTHQGAIQIAINVSTTEVAAPCVLNSSAAAPAAYTSVTIRPAADGLTVSGATVTGRGLVELNGSDNVTIDGDNPNTGGTNRNLTFTNTAVNTVTYTSAIRIAVASSIVTSANNVIIRNCMINGSATGKNTSAFISTTATEGVSFGIIAAGNASTVSETTAPSAISSTTATAPSGATWSNLTITNNQITACGKGIYVGGGVTTICNNLTISNNIIGSATPANTTTVYSMGITAQGFQAATIASNTLQNIESHIQTGIRGIDIGGISANGLNAIIENNNINGVNNNSTATYGAYGINIVGGTGHTIRNNMVQGITGDMSAGVAFSTTFGLLGIRLAAGTGHLVYHNSVYMTGARVGTPNSALLSTAFAITSTTVTGCNVRNNIFANTQTGGTTSIAYVSIFLPASGTSSMNLTLNNNAYYCNSTAGSAGICHAGTTYTNPNTATAGLFTAANFVAASTSPSTNLRSYTSILSAAGTNDNASYASSSSVPFISATDAHLNLASPEIPFVEQTGDASVGITTDIDGNTRPNAGTTLPDMGADEVGTAICSAAVGGTISPSTQSKCNGQTASMTAVGATSGTGITYQWEVSATGGGVGFSNASGGSGLTATSYTTAALAIGTYYYRLRVTCSAGPLTGYSNELTVTVTGVPTATAGSNSPICQGANINLTATTDIGTGFIWSGPGGYNANTQNPTIPNASSLNNGTYSLTIYTAAGCTSTVATTVVLVNASPTSLTAMSSSGLVCEGSTVNLSTSGGTTVGATVFSENFNAALSGWTLANTGTGGTIAAADWTLRASGYIYGTTPVTFTTPDASGFYMSNSDAQGSGSTTNTTLTSPSFSTSGFTNLSIALSHYFRYLNDSAIVQMSTDGITWENVTSYLAITGASNAFASSTITVPGTYENQASVYIRLKFHSAYGWYWAINNLSLTGTEAPVSYAWTSSPAGFTSALAAPTNVTVNVNTTYNAVVSNSAGCTDTSSVTVTANPLPTVTWNTPLAPQCETSTSYTLTGGSPAGGTYSGTAVSGANFNANMAGFAGSPYTLTYTYTDANGCTSMDTATIAVHANTTTADAGTNKTTCASAAITLTPVGTGTWTGGAGTFNGNDYTPNMSESGTTVTLTWTVAGNGPCPNAEDYVDVVVQAVPAQPTIMASNNTPCGNTQITLTATAAGGFTPVEYLWLKNGTPVNWGYSNTYVVNVGSVAGSNDYSVEIVYSGYNCVSNNSATTTVTVMAPNATITPAGPTSFCANTPTTLNASAGMTNYVWKRSAIVVQSGASSAYIPTASGNHNVTVTDASGCSKTSSFMSITVKAIPTANAGVDKTVCDGTSVQIGANSVAGNTYAWSPTTALSNASVSNPMASPSSTTTYTVTVTNTTTTCSNTDVVIVTPLIAPGTPSLSSTTTPVCQGSTISITPTVSGATSINWYKNGTLLYNKPTNFVPVISVITASPDAYHILSKGANGCLSVTSNVINAWIKEAAVPTISSTPAAVGNSINVCVPGGTTGNATLTASTTTPSPTYSWKQAANYIAGANTNTYVATVTTTQNHIPFSVEATYANGCVKTSLSKTVRLITSGCTPKLGEGKDDADMLINNEFAFSSYPNPTTGILNVEIVNSQASTGKLVLSNALGQIVLEKNILLENGKVSEWLDMSMLSAGVYSLSFQTNERQQVQKVVKE